MVPSTPVSADDLAAFLDRLPAELGQAEKEVTDPARLIPTRSAMVVEPIDEFLMLRPDPPFLTRLFPAPEHGQQIVAAFDRRARRQVGTGRHRDASSRAADTTPALLLYDRTSAAYRQSPAADIHAATAASAAVSARRIRGPRLIALELGEERTAAAFLGREAAFGTVRIMEGAGLEGGCGGLAAGLVGEIERRAASRA
jgi:hypothetical protein